MKEWIAKNKDVVKLIGGAAGGLLGLLVAVVVSGQGDENSAVPL